MHLRYIEADPTPVLQMGRPIVPTDEEMALLDTGDTTWNHIILQHTNLARRSAPLERSPAGIQVTRQLVAALASGLR